MTPEQKILLERAQESLDAARLLYEKGYARFAASRAYYTMFYLAEALLLGKGLSFSKHSAVIAAFGQHFAKTGLVPGKYHQFLISGMETKQIGDYSLEEIDDSEADLQITRAEEFLELVRRMI
jgi:uncharacterized protein (UPF0332 family)